MRVRYLPEAGPQTALAGIPPWTQRAWSVVLSSLAASTLFVWLLLFSQLMVAQCLRRTPRPAPAGPFWDAVMESVLAAATSGLALGICTDRARRGMARVTVALAAAGSVLFAFAFVTQVGMPSWRASDGVDLRPVLLVTPALSAILALVGSGLARRAQARAAAEAGALAGPASVRLDSSVRLQLALLAALWSASSFIATSQLRDLLLVASALLFALHTYPQVSYHPSLSWGGNLLVIVVALVLLWIPLRDIPLFTHGVRVGHYQWLSAYGVPYHGSYLGLLFGATPGAWAVLGSGTATVLCLLAAMALAYLLRPPAVGRGTYRYREALRRGGLAIVLASPLVFAGWTLQQLPAMLVLLLWSYYLASNMRSIRPALVWIAAMCSWAPLLGLVRYAEHHLLLASMPGSQWVPWAPMLGDFDPFNWHTDVGNSIVLLLLLVYGLLRTSRSVIERRLLAGYSVLLGLALVLTFARSAWLAAIVAVVSGAVWVGTRRRWWVPGLACAAVALLVIGQSLGYLHLNDLLDRGESNRIRMATVHQVLAILREHPLLGVAPLERDRQWFGAGETEGHGVGGMLLGWLQVPTEGGLLGTAALVMLVATLAKKVSSAIERAPAGAERVLLQCSALALVALGVSNLTDNPMVYAGSTQAPILLGLVLGQTRLREKPDGARSTTAASAAPHGREPAEAVPAAAAVGSGDQGASGLA